MGTFCFFPWFSILDPITIGRFTVFPHRLKSKSPYGVPQAIDNIASSYKCSPGRSVNEISVLHIEGLQFDSDFDQETHSEVFDFSETLSMAALCAREFFNTESQYTNSDSLSLVAQRFVEGSNFVAVEARLRSGTLTQVHSDYISLAPAHVRANSRVYFDNELGSALHSAKNQDGGFRFAWSTHSFLRANSDSSSTTEQTEIVLTTGAFESLLQLTSGKADDLAKAVCKSLSLFDENLTLALSTRLAVDESLKKYPSVRHLWVLDLYKSRNSFAHGARERTRTRPIWSNREHLLLAAYIYPIVLKAELQNAGFYKLTDEDIRRIRSFDYLLRIHSLFATGNRWDEASPPNDSIAGAEFDEDEGKFLWNLALNEARLRDPSYLRGL